jgi:two-component system CheB/CheR fusion protein
LLSCRNALMYFDAGTQGRIIARFSFALNEGGYLLLGKAETMLMHTSMFVPVDLKRRVFQKVARGRGTGRALQGGRVSAPAEGEASGADLRDATLRAGSVAQIVVDRHGVVALANERANGLFRLGLADVGRPLSDLDLSYRPIELRSLIDQAYAERRLITRTGVEWRPHGSGEGRWFDV